MVAEATSQSRQPGFALPASIHRRQVWRPAALRGGQSILAGIASRVIPLEVQRARLTAWYEQFVQRSQPFLGWQPSTTAELGAHETQFSLGNPPSAEPITRSESPMISKELPPSTRSVSMTQDQASSAHPRRFPPEQKPPEPFALRRSISGPIDLPAKWTSPNRPLAGDLPAQYERSREAAVQPVAPSTRKETIDNLAAPADAPEEKRLSARDGRFATGDWESESLRASAQRNQERPLERPALRLAILRPIHTAVATVQRKESDPLPSSASDPAIGKTEYFGVGHWPAEARSRLISSMSFPQRQEVRGGFPAHLKGEVRPDADTSSEGLLRGWGREASAVRDDAVMRSRSLVSLREAEIPGPPAIPPATPPGIQIRLLGTDESNIQTSGNDFAKPGRPTTATPVPQPPPPAAPPLDINAVADKVFQTLQRRHQLERERRGLY